MADYARSVNILVEIAGNPEAKLDAVNRKLDNLSNKKVTVGSSASGATDAVSRLSSTTDKASESFTSLGSKITSAFGNVKSSLNDVKSSIQDMSGALMGITVGGAVSGLAWLSKAKSNLYVAEMKAAIESNRQLKISFDDLQSSASQQAEMGLGTTSSNMKEAYATIMAGGKYLGKNNKNKVDQAGYLEAFFLSRKEMLEEQGITSTEQLVKRLTMQSGDISKSWRAKALGTALGISLDDSSMKSAQKRIDTLIKMGSTIDVQAQIDLRPWEKLESRISQLKSSIADSIAGPMTVVTNVVANFVQLITKIPGGSALIGYAGMFLAIASATSIVIGVMTPLWTFMKAVNAAMGISTILKAADASATVADASAHAMLTGAMEGEFVATELTTAAQNMSFAARIRLIGATLWDTAARYANSVANFLGISSLLGLAAAETTAAGGATLLGTSLNLAVAPLWLIIGAGLVLVGVFTAILAKAGVLEPLLKGISKINFGKVWKEFVSGDFGGAWNQLTKGFNLPSFSETLKNFFSGTSFFSVVTRLLGVPLYKIIDFMSSILDVVKKIKDFVDWIIGLFYKYIWTPLKGIWDYAKSVAEYLVGGSALSGEELKTAWVSALKSGNNVGLTVASQEKIDAIWDVITGKRILTQQEKNKLQITDPELADAKSAYEKLKNPTGVLNQGVSGFADNVVSGIKSGLDDATKVAADKTNEALTSGSGSGFASADWSVLSPVKYAWNALEGIYHAVTKNALGGEVTKSGLAIVDEGEPIIPAEINRSSNLIDLLETLASGNISNSKSSNIVINFDYTATGTGTGNGMYLDQFAFERKVKEIIGKCTRTYGSY